MAGETRKVFRDQGGDRMVMGTGGILAGAGAGSPAPCLELRMRVTAAQVNAGLTLLAAPGAGNAYRVHDVDLISVGGAAAGATTVDILGLFATVSTKILAAAIAGLTQSTRLRAGAANAAILADGASFLTTDENSAISIGKTGASLTGSTNIDVLLRYAVDKV